jgi:tetratricopeptide (TPR) repeat protein
MMPPIAQAREAVIPDWQSWHLDEDILTEPIAISNRVALWVPGDRGNDYQDWQRISLTEQTGLAVEPGIVAAAASSITARCRVQSLLGRWFRRAPERSWQLPNGQAGEQQGGRRSDMLLVWGEGPSPDEGRLKARWPQSDRIRQLGRNLFLVYGIAQENERPKADSPRAEPEPPMPPEADCARAREIAEQLLQSARAAGDRQKEASALTDLGVVYLYERKAEEAIAALSEALKLARELGDRPRETDILGNLGVLTMAAGDPGRAREIFDMTLAGAREAGDRFAEKLAFERIGLACVKLNDPERALQAFRQALTLARALGHGSHEAELLWSVGIQCAELGRRDEAMTHAQAAIDLLHQIGNPQAAWFAEHLSKYRAGEAMAAPSGASEAGAAAMLGSALVAGMWSDAGGTSPGQVQKGPGLLRMALSAAKSMAQFIGSGFKTVPAAALRQRLDTCAACEHYTGLRCRLCGCFVSAKARLAHEQCPLGKWRQQL